MSDAWCDQCDRYYDPSKEHDCRVMAPEEAQANRLPHAWRPAWKRAAEAGGSLRGDGAEGAVTIKVEAGAVHIDRPHVATLPTGERVELPAGTVLRETPPPVATPQENFAALKRMYPSLAGTYERAAAKHEIAPWDVAEEQLWEECPALRPVDPDEPKPLGEQLHDEHDRASHADGSPCARDPQAMILADLAERIGLPREMVPSVTANGNGNAETCGAVAGPTTCANRQWLAGSRVCSRAPHVGGAHEMDRYGDAWYGSPDDPPTKART